jgi:molybdate transport system ATP-binding protein
LGQVPIVSGRIRYHFSENDHQSWTAVAGQMGYVAPELQREIFARENRKDFFRELSGKRQEFTSVKELIVHQAAGDTRQIHHDETLREVAARIGIEQLLQRNVNSLTTGEMNSVLIARALFNHPKLLILDEPFAGLDEPTRRALADIINTLTQKNLQLILITHRFDEIVPSVTHILMLKQGQIYKAGKKEAVFRPKIIEQTYELNKPALRLDPQTLFSTPRGSAAKNPQMDDRIPSAEPHVLIEMKKVTVQYGSELILDGFNWKVKDGENWMIRGPSAAGKSTVLALIHGDNLQAYANEIYLFGQKRGAGQSIWDIKEKIGFISSDWQLRQHQHTNAFEVVCSGFFASNGLYRKCSADQLAIADAWSRFLGINDLADQKFGRLSHGQRQLILLARAMVKSPVFLILDEPLQGLDIKNKAKLRNVFDYIGYHTPTNLIYVPEQEAEELNCITHVLQMDRGKAIQTRLLGKENTVHRDTHQVYSKRRNS